MRLAHMSKRIDQSNPLTMSHFLFVQGLLGLKLFSEPPVEIQLIDK